MPRGFHAVPLSTLTTTPPGCAVNFQGTEMEAELLLGNYLKLHSARR